MKKLILLLFIPLVSFGQEESKERLYSSIENNKNALINFTFKIPDGFNVYSTISEKIFNKEKTKYHQNIRIETDRVKFKSGSLKVTVIGSERFSEKIFDNIVQRVVNESPWLFYALPKSSREQLQNLEQLTSMANESYDDLSVIFRIDRNIIDNNGGLGMVISNSRNIDGYLGFTLDKSKGSWYEFNQKSTGWIKKEYYVIVDDWTLKFDMRITGKKIPKQFDKVFTEIINSIKIGETLNLVDEVPIFPGCEIGNNEKRGKCMSEKISKFVQNNFNISLAGDLGLTGRQRINVIFKIDKNGDVIDIRARAPHPRLENEAIRVINLLPKIQPGKFKGKTVIVPYSLPIIFQVKEEKKEEELEPQK